MNTKKKSHSNTFGYAKLLEKNESVDLILSRIIGNTYTEYRENWARISKGELLTEFPIHLNFELNHECNLKCSICLTAHPPDTWNLADRKNKIISLETFKKIIDEGVPKGLRSISLNGFNEPLLLGNIPDYVRYAKQNGIVDIILSTNGTLLTEESSRALIKSGLTRMLVSIDAVTEETYKKIRKGGRFDKVVNSLTRFMEIKIEEGSVLPLVRASFVRNKKNHMEQDAFIRFWEDKVDYVIIQKFSNPFVGTERFHQIEAEHQFEYVEPMAICYQPFQRLFISCNGDVFPCCSDYGQRFIVGNIYENSVSEIWKKPNMISIRENVNGSDDGQPAFCRQCRHRQSE